MILSSFASYAQAAYDYAGPYLFRRLSDCVIISVRGTRDPKDFVTDARFLKTDFLGFWAHEGFVSEFNAIWNAVSRSVSPMDIVYITGHSLGGAIATLLAFAFKVRLGVESEVVTFGSPRVFDPEGVRAYNGLCPRTTRVVHRWDLVPRIPKLDYSHVNRELHLDDNGKVLLPDHHFLRRLFRILCSDLDGLSLENHKMRTYLNAVYAYEARRK